MNDVTFDMRALICDLDGTLVDTLPGISFSVNRAVTDVAPGTPVPDLAELVGPPVRRLLVLALGELAQPTLDALEASFRVSYDAEGWSMCAPFPQVAVTLDALSSRGVRCFVATNKPAKPTLAILGALELDRYFDEIVAPDSRAPKFGSKYELVAHLIRGHALDPERTVLIGDASDDAIAAAKAGIPFAAAAYGYGDAATHPELDRRWSLEAFSALLDLPEEGT